MGSLIISGISNSDIHTGDITTTVTAGGDIVGGDKITVGNVSGSYTAIGQGAQVIVTQIQQVRSAIEEMEQAIQAAERRLADAITSRSAAIPAWPARYRRAGVTPIKPCWITNSKTRPSSTAGPRPSVSCWTSLTATG